MLQWQHFSASTTILSFPPFAFTARRNNDDKQLFLKLLHAANGGWASLSGSLTGCWSALHSGTYLVIFAVPLLRKPALGGFEAQSSTKPIRWWATLPTRTYPSRLLLELLPQLYSSEARRQGRRIGQFTSRLAAFGWPAIDERTSSFDLVTQTWASSHWRRVIALANFRGSESSIHSVKLMRILCIQVLQVNPLLWLLLLPRRGSI